MNSSTALVTGGTGRLGSVLVKGLVSEGWRVAFSSRSPESAAALVDDVEALRQAKRVIGIPVDLSQEGGTETLLSTVQSHGIEPSCLINCVRDAENLRVNRRGVPDREAWRREFALGVVAAHDLAVGLVATGDNLRTVVNISSMYGVVAPNPQLYRDPLTTVPIHYGVCKAALNQLTKELAVRLAPRGVRVNSVSFGGIEGRVDAAFQERYGKLCPMGRMLEDDDLLAPVLFLASRGSSGITGHNLVVDGGWSIW